MTRISTRPSANDIFGAMKINACYHTTDPYGQHVLWQSNDLDDLSIRRLIAEHDFVEKVRDRKDLAFDIERNLDGPKLQRALPLAKFFYDLTAMMKGNIPPRHCDSEQSTLLSMTANALGLQYVTWSGNPLSVISHDGLLEGELINTLVSRLRTATNQANFKAVTKRKKDAVAKMKSDFKRYEARLFSNDPNYHALCFDLGCVNGDDAILLIKSLNYIDTLTDMFDKAFDSCICGYWWRREYLSEIGYRYHLIVFVSSSAPYPPNILINEILAQWHTVTQGRSQGHCYNYEFTNSYRGWGVGPISSPGNRDALLNSVALMLETEKYLSLSHQPSHEHFGMGKLPKKNSVISSGVIGDVHQNHALNTSLQAAIKWRNASLPWQRII